MFEQAQETRNLPFSVVSVQPFLMFVPVSDCLLTPPTRTDVTGGGTPERGGCAQGSDQALCVQQPDGLRVSLLLPPGHNLGQYTQVRSRDVQAQHSSLSNSRTGEPKIKVCRLLLYDYYCISSLSPQQDDAQRSGQRRGPPQEVRSSLRLCQSC